MHDAGRLTGLGWAAFALYLTAALLSFGAARASARRQSAAARGQGSSETGRLWFGLGVMLAALGLNKPLNLQTRLIELGRHLAGRANLSAHATGLHLVFFLGFVLLVIALGSVIRFRFAAPLGRFARRQPLAAAGCALIFIYILIRAVSIDRVDQMLGFNLDQSPCLWMLEAGGLLLLIAQALRVALAKPNG